jgi:DNA transposition AAA+ family ATPase
MTIDTDTATETTNATTTAVARRDDADASAVSHSRNYNIPGDVVNKATADLPDDQRAAVRWLHHHCAENNTRLNDIADKIRRPDGSAFSDHTLWRVLTGRYGAELDKITAAILGYKKFVEERATIRRAPFIMIRVAKRIFALCDSARMYSKVVFIFGASQTGKTTALEEYQRAHNHGETIYLRMPAGGNLRAFMEELAISLRISPQQSSTELRRRIVRSFDERMLLIVDEAHQLFVKGIQVKTIELIREIHDRCKMGVVLVGTEILASELQEGKHKELLRQLDLRSLAKARLKPTPSKSDLNTFAEHYNLAPAAGEALKLESETIRDFGLGRWCTLLQAGSRMAAKKSQKLSWDHVVKAHATLTALESTNLD